MNSHIGTFFKKLHRPRKGPDIRWATMPWGPSPHLDCAVKCEVYPAYRIRIEQEGGKPTSAFPQLIHGYGALWCEVKHFSQSFFLGQPINYNPQFCSDDQ